MFTGIIEEIGIIKSISLGSTYARLSIEAHHIMQDVQLGDSVAVNGTCLTVCSKSTSSFEADVMNETLKRTGLGHLSKGSSVNLERAMAANGRFGGHMVSGHIDGTGTIKSFQKDGIATILTVCTSPAVMRYIIEKGSIAIDGTSLTVTQTNPTEQSFQVSLIPHTAQNTILLTKKCGETVNLENDIVGKYIEHFLHPDKTDAPGETGITAEFLAKCGF